MEIKKRFKCRYAPSLGAFESTPTDVWGTEEYNPNSDINEPTVFMGLYGLNDFYHLWRHRGYRWVLWCGSDIRHFKAGYWLDDKGAIRMTARPLATWINKNCEVYVENTVEQKVLQRFGIGTSVVPSFLGDVNKFPPQKIRTDKKRYYSSVSGNDFKLYGWDKIVEIAKHNPNNEYYLYGNTSPLISPTPNVIIRGRVSSEQMNEETKTMTGAIRMVEFEGFSEIIAKSILWGQKPISLIPYDYTRESLLNVLNKYPWNTK